MTDYYLVTLEEIGELIDITEDLTMEDRKSECVKIARKRIDLVNKIKARKYTEKYKEERVVQQIPDPKDFRYDPKDFRYYEEEPPDYEDCPCWMSPADPEGTTGTCEGDYGDCKLWYWNCDNRSYTECGRFAKDCSRCLEILCKFRKVE
jgi:hypothetical protein